MRTLLTFLALCWALVCSAQSWQADWQAEGHPKADHWRYDREAFLQHGGRLSLSVADSITAGQAVLMTDVILPATPCWSGTVRLGIRPTRYNHPTILLCATQALPTGGYEYLALDFGGAVADQISLLRVVASRTERSATVAPRTDLTPLAVASLELRQGAEIAFLLIYLPEHGWKLYLQDRTQGGELTLQSERSDYRPELTAQNSLGISCDFTAKGRRAWSFRDFALTPFSEDLLHPREEVPPPSPASPPLLLSEVMASPKGNAPEYVELYNPTDHPISLAGYQLVAGTNEEHLHACALPDKPIQAHSYALLTREVAQLRASYPQIPADALTVPVALPRLPNRGGLLALVTLVGELTDRMDYSKELFPPKLRRLTGIALERADLLQPTEPATWRPASSSAGYATPGLPPSPEDFGEAEGTEGQSLEALLTQLAQKKELSCQWDIFSLLGEHLASGAGEAGKALLLALRHDPAQLLAPVATSLTGRSLLLRIHWTSSSEAGQQTFLLSYRQR